MALATTGLTSVPTTPTLSLGSIYKTLYPSVEEVLAACPLLALMPKNTKAAAINQFTIVGANGTSGAGATLSDAQTNVGASKPEGFLVTLGSLSGVAQVSSKALAVAKQKEAAVVIDVYKRAFEDAHNALFRVLCYSVYGDGTGIIGTASSISTGVISLSSKLDTIHFQEGDYLDLVNAAGTTALGNYGYVVGVDDDAGTITVATTRGGSAGTPTNWDTDIGNGTYPYLALKGLIGLAPVGTLGWIPATMSASDSFFNMNRSVSPWYRGVYHDGSANPSINDALIDAIARTSRRNGYANKVFCSSLSWAALQKEYGDHVRYSTADLDGKPAGSGFKAIEIMTSKGPALVIMDPHCPDKTAIGMPMDTWECLSAGEMIQLDNFDSLDAKPLATVAGIEIRTVSYCNFATGAPYKTFRALLSA